DPEDLRGYAVECLASELQLLAVNAPVDDGPPGSGGVQRHDHRLGQPGDTVQLRGDVPLIVLQWAEQPLSDPVERHVVVPGGGDQRRIGEAVEKRSGGDELLLAGSLREIPGGDDEVRP